MPKRKRYSDRQSLQPRAGTSVLSALHLRVLAGAALIVAAVVIAYLPSINGGFIWDDKMLLSNNQIIIAPDGLYRFWCTTETIDYWPVSNTTFWLEWRLWGMNSTGYHVTNLILHIATTLLIWVILRKLSIPGAFFAGLIFAVHPVNVESVAWIAQRKGLLAMLFCLLSILFYLQAKMQLLLRNRGPAVDRWYWLSLGAFVLAMLSKGSVAVLPVLLLVIVWWQRPLTRRDIVRTAPFFVVAVVLAGVNVWFQTHGTGQVIRSASFWERLLGAGGVVWFYLYKALLPLDLVFIYPQWHIEAGNLLWWLPLMAAVAVTVVLWRYREGWSRPFLFVWGFFCVALLPVLGFIDVYFMKFSLVADHYQHLALIGVITLVAAGLSVWHERVQGVARWAANTVAVVVVGTLTVLTCEQSGLYSSEMTLYQATLEKNPDSCMAHNNLGNALFQAGRTEEAFEHYQQALRIKADYPEAHFNLGVALVQAGRLPEAIEHFQHTLRLDHNFFEAHLNLGLIMAKANRFPEAIESFQQAVKLKSDYPNLQYNLGLALAKAGRQKEAIESFQQALRLNPDSPEAHNNLGILLFQTGRSQAAIEHFEQALRLKSDFIMAYSNLASAYAEMHQATMAIATAQKALELARSQGQTMTAKRIEDWLNSYRASLSGPPSAAPPSK